MGWGHKSIWQSLIKILSAPSKVHLKLYFAFRWKVLLGGGHFIDKFINVWVGDVHRKSLTRGQTETGLIDRM